MCPNSRDGGSGEYFLPQNSPHISVVPNWGKLGSHGESLDAIPTPGLGENPAHPESHKPPKIPTPAQSHPRFGRKPANPDSPRSGTPKIAVFSPKKVSISVTTRSFCAQTERLQLPRFPERLPRMLPQNSTFLKILFSFWNHGAARSPIPPPETAFPAGKSWNFPRPGGNLGGDNRAPARAWPGAFPASAARISPDRFPWIISLDRFPGSLPLDDFSWIISPRIVFPGYFSPG